MSIWITVPIALTVNFVRQNYIIDKRIIILQEQAKRSLNGDCSTTSSNTSSSGTASEYSQSDSTDEDPELKPADYWKCVKCKNSQNNPLYRYCEKCYQVRQWTREAAWWEGRRPANQLILSHFPLSEHDSACFVLQQLVDSLDDV